MTSKKKMIPLITAIVPLVIPRDFLSPSTKLMSLAVEDSFQYWRIKTPEAMNMTHPNKEKNKSILLLIGVLIM